MDVGVGVMVKVGVKVRVGVGVLVKVGMGVTALKQTLSKTTVVGWLALPLQTINP